MKILVYDMHEIQCGYIRVRVKHTCTTCTSSAVDCQCDKILTNLPYNLITEGLKLAVWSPDMAVAIVKIEHSCLSTGAHEVDR